MTETNLAARQRDRASIFQTALNTARGELSEEYHTASDKAAEGGNLFTGAMDAVNSAGLGVAKAVIETKELVTGQPNYEDQHPIQRAIEADAAELDRRSPVNAIVGDIAQFATGMVGLGKIGRLVKLGQFVAKGGRLSRLAYEISRGAAAGAITFDPQESRLSNLIESFPSLHNPVTDYLAADITDTDAEGRFKSALEGVGLDLALAGVFGAAVKVYKGIKSGAPDEVVAAAERELEEAQAAFPGDQPMGGTGVDLMETMDPEVRVEGPAERTITDETGEVIGRTPLEQPAEGPIEITVVGGGAKPEPLPKAPQDLPAENVDALIEGWRKDSEAIDTYGSREAAEENGYIFGQSGQLPWQKMAEGTDDMRAFTERLAETFKTELDAAKGGDVLSDDRVAFMVGQRAWLFGDDPAALMGMIRKAGDGAKSMVANMEAAYSWPTSPSRTPTGSPPRSGWGLCPISAGTPWRPKQPSAPGSACRWKPSATPRACPPTRAARSAVCGPSST